MSETIWITEEHLGSAATRADAERLVERLQARGWAARYGTGAPWRLDPEDRQRLDTDWALALRERDSEHAEECDGHCQLRPAADGSGETVQSHGGDCPRCGAAPCQVMWHGDGSHTCRPCYEADPETAWVTTDWENGCEECWTQLRSDLETHGLPEGGDHEPFAAPPGWVEEGDEGEPLVGRPCPHGGSGPGQVAPSILLVTDRPSDEGEDEASPHGFRVVGS